MKFTFSFALVVLFSTFATTARADYLMLTGVKHGFYAAEFEFAYAGRAAGRVGVTALGYERFFEPQGVASLGLSIAMMRISADGPEDERVGTLFPLSLMFRLSRLFFAAQVSLVSVSGNTQEWSPSAQLGLHIPLWWTHTEKSEVGWFIPVPKVACEVYFTREYAQCWAGFRLLANYWQ